MHLKATVMTWTNHTGYFWTRFQEKRRQSGQRRTPPYEGSMEWETNVGSRERVSGWRDRQNAKQLLITAEQDYSCQKYSLLQNNVTRYNADWLSQSIANFTATRRTPTEVRTYLDTPLKVAGFFQTTIDSGRRDSASMSTLNARKLRSMTRQWTLKRLKRNQSRG